MVRKTVPFFLYALIFLVNINILEAQETADLTSLNVLVNNLPSGAAISWHTATPATDLNEIVSGNPLTDATAVPVGATYYMAFKDAANNCYSPTVAVPVLSNICFNTGADLTSLDTSETNNPGSGVTLSFHTSVTASAGNLVNDSSSASNGIYYAAFFDSINNCYSENTTPVLVVTSTCAKIMLTQIYHSSTLGKVIEVTNIDASLSAPANAINIALFSNKTGAQIDVTPDNVYTVVGALLPGQSALIKTGSLSGVSIIKSPVEELESNITSFDGGDDILILTSRTDARAWEKRIDVVESISNNTSYVRIDEVTDVNTTYTATEWVAFVDEGLDPYRDLGSGGPERHPHDPLLSEINTPNAESNNGLGLHRINLTTRTGSAWSNGYPDRSRHVVVDEDYSHSGDRLSARKLVVNNNSKLAITDNLLAVTNDITLTNSGDEIRLVGTSQLVQTHTSTTQILGNGKLLVDQNSIVPSLYRYNYIGSPVNSTGQTSYTFADVVKDGTSPLTVGGTINSDIAKDITFVGGYNGSITNPISLADHWIYTYGASESWVHKYSTGSIPQTDGVIFKGPGRAQNYTFVGTPKDGTIQTTVAASTSYLLGNPFASAIRSQKFIEDNLTSTTGTLYFWEHQESINGDVDQSSHNFGGYVGGYAIRNIAMGIAANSVTGNDSSTGIAGLGEGVYREPAEYIAIGQGFFVGGSATGGIIEFNNSQREFISEGAQSIFFRNIEDDSTETNNSTLPILKLGMNYMGDDEVELHRQIGISFLQGNTFGCEKGYDSSVFDLGSTDIYWDFEGDDDKYSITGVGEITQSLQVPLTIVINYQGDVKLIIDEWANIDRDVYLIDFQNEMNYLLSDDPIVLTLDPGEYKERFVLTFGGEVLSTNPIDQKDELVVYSDNFNDEIVIKNFNDLKLKKATLYNILGKEIQIWDELQEKGNGQITNLKVNKSMIGIYILKVITDKGLISKKMYLNY